jgi:peptidyl-prolyl cis-trans isomerase B (cyclophilin B)
MTRLTRVFGAAATACLCFAFAAPCAAQLIPSRKYFGVDRPIPMEARVQAAGEARIELFDPDQADPISRAPVAAGAVNLASLFPSLWERRSPRVRYAQLVVADKPVGPPVVLVPMVNPPVPMLFDREVARPWYVDPATGKPNEVDPRKAAVVFTPDEAPCYTGVRAYVDRHVVFETTLGAIEFRMRPDCAPNTVRNFLDLVAGGFYTDIVFHRIAARTRSGDPFVVQVGDPSGTGDGGPGYNIDLEDSPLPHDFGVLSMARNTDPNTNGCQVFIALSREGTARLDGKYTAFAQAVSGADVILALAATPVKPGTDTPESAPVLLSARLVDAPPWGTGAAPVARPQGTAPAR